MRRWSGAARVAVTATVAYCIVKLPPAASMAAPKPARISRCPAAGICAEDAGRRHLVQPLVAGVAAVPVEPPLLRLAERARLPHPVGRLGAQRPVRVRAAGPGPAAEERRVGHHPAVDRGEGLGQVGRGLEHVPEHGQPPAGPQRPRRLGRAGHRVHPVPGLPGDDRVEFPAGAVPGLERRHLDLEPVPPRQVGHPRVGLDAEHPAARPPGTAGPRCRSRSRRRGTSGPSGAPRGRHDPLHQRAGVARPGPVVAVGVRAERLRHLAGLVGSRSAERRSRRR